MVRLIRMNALLLSFELLYICAILSRHDEMLVDTLVRGQANYVRVETAPELIPSVNSGVYLTVIKGT